MKRCPKCNRTYPTDTQRFCTHDGGMLAIVEAPPAQTVSDHFADPDAPTKVISRELVPDVASKYDPLKTTIGAPPDRTSEMRGRTTADLSQQAAPPPPAEKQTSASLPTLVSPPVSQQLGEVTPPSMESVLPPTQRISGSLPLSSFGPADASAPPPVPPPAPAQQTSGSLPSDSGPIASPPAFSATMPVSQFTSASQARRVEPLTAPPPVKKSKLPLVLGILAFLFVLGAGALGVAYFFVFRPMIEARRAVATPIASPQQNPVEAPPNAETTPVQPETTPTPAENVPPPFTPPANAVQFVNSSDKLDGKLAEHYVDFSFYYPDNWQ